jgi:MIP family channel proteins
MNKQPTSLILEQSQRNQEQESVPEPLEQTLWTQCVAEALGTFGLVFAGPGAIMIDTLSKGQITHVGVGLVFGLIITTMIYAFGHISGAHFNPAVTLAFVLVRHFSKRRLLFYWVAQFVGATLAALCLRLLLGDVASLGATLPAGNGGAWQSFGLETVLTFFLMVVIMAMATDTRAVGQAAALAIGATVMLEALFAGPISGASMNPARSLGPALVSWTWTAQWVYLAGPFLGAIAGAFVYRYLREAGMRSHATQRAEKERTSPTFAEELHD